MLREHLSKLLNLPAAQIAVEPNSVPQILTVISQDDDLAARAVSNSLDVKLAEQKVAAAKARAQGEHKALTMPTVDLASQYAYLAKYNNYDTLLPQLHGQQLQRRTKHKVPYLQFGAEG